MSICHDCAAPEIEPLGEPLDDTDDADLIDHLGKLARAHGAHQGHRPGVTIDHRAGALEGRLVAADHDRQHAALGAALTARYRRIEEADAVPCPGLRDLAGDAGGGGGVIDQDGALGQTGERPMGAEHDASEVVVIADADEGNLGAFGGGGGGRGVAAAMSRNPGFGLGGGAVIDG